MHGTRSLLEEGEGTTFDCHVSRVNVSPTSRVKRLVLASERLSDDRDERHASASCSFVLLRTYLLSLHCGQTFFLSIDDDDSFEFLLFLQRSFTK